MGNGYFNHDIQLLPGTKARAEDVNDRFNGAVLGFDHLPDPHPTKQGFGEPVPMSNATALDEAATAGQIVGSMLTYGTDTGTANAYVVTLPVAPAAYANGVIVMFPAANSCSGAATINVNGLGIKVLADYAGRDLLADDILAGAIIQAVYDDGKFKVISCFDQYDSSSAANAAAAQSSAESALASEQSASHYPSTMAKHLKHQW